MALPGELKAARDGTARTVVILGMLNILYGLGTIFLQMLPFVIIELFPPRQQFDAHFSPFTLKFALSIMFIVGGVGLLFFMRWGRVLSAFAAIGTIAISIFSFVRTTVYELRVGGSGEESFFLGFIIAAFLKFVLLIYPVLLLVLLCRNSGGAKLEN